VLILKRVKVVCFDTPLEVLILKGLTLHKNCAKRGIPRDVLILNSFKLFRINTCIICISVDSKRVVAGKRESTSGAVRGAAGHLEALGKRGHMGRRALPAAGRLRECAELTLIIAY
jgi:hypothetical protein